MRLYSIFLFALAFPLFLNSSVDASATKTIYTFCKMAGCADGQSPNGLISDAVGNLYGTTQDGGAHGGGTVFELVRPEQEGGKWKQKVLYNFCSSARECSDGSDPASPLVIDTQGNLYGATSFGGKFVEGEIFMLSPATGKRASWKIDILASFCNKGIFCAHTPQFGLAYSGQSSGTPYDGVSPLFGTSNGGDDQGEDCIDGCGTVFELTPGKKSKLEVIYNFCMKQLSCPDGATPAGPLLVDASGNLIGTTANGGANGNNGGTVFELTKAAGQWQENALYSFCNDNCLDGSAPESGVVADSAGNLFGTTQFGGAQGKGVLFKLIAGDPAQLVVLHDFCSSADCGDGSGPYFDGLLIDASGNLFGTATNGGGNDDDFNHDGGGTIFSFSPHFHRMHAFCEKPNCADGEYPAGPLVLAPTGKIYGATAGDGRTNFGMIFEATP